MGQACVRDLPVGEVLPPPVPVTLNIYDIGTNGEVAALNRVLRPLGTGAFHCGVEVFGLEWSYGDFPTGTGLFSCDPRSCGGQSYCESVPLGNTRVLCTEMQMVLKRLEHRWKGKDYDILKRNCCHFCREFCQLLAVRDVPHWVMNLAIAGAAVADAEAEFHNKRRSLSRGIASRLSLLCCENTRQAPPVDMIPMGLVEIPVHSEHELDHFDTHFDL